MYDNSTQPDPVYSFPPFIVTFETNRNKNNAYHLAKQAHRQFFLGIKLITTYAISIMQGDTIKIKILAKKVANKITQHYPG